MSDGSIAIIGASCRFPGAPGLEAFWELLSAGRDAVSEIDPARWSTRFFYHPTRGQPGKSYTWAAGLIDDPALFEPEFFGISPREAQQMDPQQRILLELAWHAIEDSGLTAAHLAGGDTGVFIGGSSTDYRDLRLGDPASAEATSMTGGTLSILANRISYVFDLRGPSLAIDTACSSSLVALHHACEAIRAGRISSAVVGGINLLLAPYPFLGFSRAAMLSRRGRCFAFDERADGYVRGEGGGIVILKSLAAALADGDRVRGVIRATGVNSDGRTVGLSLPSQAAQMALLREVYERGEVAPDDLAFFEMHGTGTPAGDPLEAAAVGEAIARTRHSPLPIGSVKTNIGHLEPASGMAGLIKAALALERGSLPASLHCEQPNPAIPFAALNLRLAAAAEALAPAGCAGVNSFGFGGTNAHAVLAPPPRRSPPPGEAHLPPLVISARTEASLRQLAQHWRDVLSEAPAGRAPALLRTAARHRDRHAHHLVALGHDAADTSAKLTDFLAGSNNPAIVTGSAVRDGKLAFVYAGNGAQWPGMGRAAYHASTAFRDAVCEADACLRPALGWSAAELLARGVDAEELAHADVAQPLLFAIQVGTVTVLRALGVEPAGHIGHSVGEIAAAWGAGALSLATAARVVVARSRQQERTRGMGRMAAVALSDDAAGELIRETGSPLEVGAINARQAVTVSGPCEAIARLGAEAHRRGLAFRALDLDFAFHSRAMEPIREDLLGELSGLSSGAPAQLLVSTVTGERVAAGELGADYWWRNIRCPVRFTDGMAALVGDGFRIFVEIGPNPVLQAYLHDALRAADRDGRVVASLSRKEDAGDPFPIIAARVHVAGADIGAGAAFDGATELDGVPLYPWQRERCWFARTAEDLRLLDPPFDHPLLGFRQPGVVANWLNHLDPEALPWLADHRIEGVPVLPATAVLEMALAAARLRRPEAGVVEVADVELRRPLPFEAGRSREIRTVAGGEDGGDWELASRTRLADEPLTQHAVARLVSVAETWEASPLAATPSAPSEIDGDALYRLASRLGLDYGAQFRSVRRVLLLGDGEALAELDPAVTAESGDYLIHPALLDGALQALLALIVGHGNSVAGVSFLPWRFGRVRAAAPFGRAVRHAWVRLTRLASRSAAADIVLFDAAGQAISELSDCWFRRVDLGRRGSPEEHALRVDLVPAPLDAGTAPPVLERVAEIVARLLDNPAAPDRRRQEQALLLDALAAAIAREALLSAVDPEVPFTVDELVDTGAIAPDAATLALSLLRLIERFAAAAASGPVWRIAGECALPDVAELWRALLAEAPELVAELALLGAAAEVLPRRLVHGPAAAMAMPAATVEHLRHGSPTGAAGIELLAGLLGEIAAGWPRGRALRVLEIGADEHPTLALRRRLAHLGVDLDGRTVGTDLEEETAAPAEDETRDAIVAVHPRQLVDMTSLARLRDRLRPGGLFFAVAASPNALWDVVFGGCEASQRPAVLAPEEWHSELAAAGFVEIGSAPLADGVWPSAAVWGRAPPAEPAAEPATPLPASVSLIGVGAGGAVLRDALDRLGIAASEIDPADFIDGAAAAEGGGDTAICVVDESDDEVEQAARMIPRVARVAAAAAQRGMPLWLVTAGAHQVAPGAGLVGAALWGLARVLANEVPRLTLRLIDLPPQLGWRERGEIIAGELTMVTPETEIVWTADGRHVPRLRRGLPPRRAAATDAVALAASQRGGFDALGWRPMTPRLLKAGEVQVEVRAAGLNFRDLMWAMGLLPEEALIDGFAGAGFGLECAGTVAAVGPGAADLAVGDRVAGFAPNALATRVTTAAHALTRIPDETSFAAAATIPVAFVTAAYALGTLAQLAPGESVLIHAAAGGVGLAAIQYAKHRGALVIATAGSELKRSFLRLAGADHVLDSRDLGFAAAVRALTDGRGVDVVLNSLSGEAMEESLGVLKPFGRFLELGKRDYYLNRRIHLRPLRQNVSYFAIDVDQLPVQRPELARALLGEIAALLRDGAIRPLAHRTFAFAEVGEAFRLMQASGHIGKLVLLPTADLGVQLQPATALRLRRDGSYLVTGGLSGFGFAAARWLAEHGAGAIALVGRRGAATPGAAEQVAELRGLGAEIHVVAADVGDPDALAAALDEIRRTLPALRGVVHAASAIADGMAAELEGVDIAGAMRAKFAGAVALDRLTRDDPLDLFVLFSSATTLLGAPGQGVYVAGNLALEALARRRQAEGLPALAVAWGPIEDAGYLAERPQAREALARRLGARPMPAAQALAVLPALLDSGLPAVALAATSWGELRGALPILAAPLFAEMRTEGRALPDRGALAEQLAGLDGEEALTLLKTVVAEEAAAILRLDATGIDQQRPLSEVGMDSLMAVELRLALESRLGIDLPLMSLAEGTSVASIAARLASAFGDHRTGADLVSLAERYEGPGEHGAVQGASAAARDEEVAVNSAAAE